VHKEKKPRKLQLCGTLEGCADRICKGGLWTPPSTPELKLEICVVHFFPTDFVSRWYRFISITPWLLLVNTSGDFWALLYEVETVIETTAGPQRALIAHHALLALFCFRTQYSVLIRQSFSFSRFSKYARFESQPLLRRINFTTITFTNSTILQFDSFLFHRS